MLLAAAVLGVAAIGWRHALDEPLGDADDQPGPAAPAGQEKVVHSDLEVVMDEGQFGGTIQLTNRSDRHADVLVTVHVFYSDQEVGELHGDLTLKPQSTALADLWSADDFRSFDGTVVDLFAFPVSVD